MEELIKSIKPFTQSSEDPGRIKSIVSLNKSKGLNQSIHSISLVHLIIQLHNEHLGFEAKEVETPVAFH